MISGVVIRYPACPASDHILSRSLAGMPMSGCRPLRTPSRVSIRPEKCRTSRQSLHAIECMPTCSGARHSAPDVRYPVRSSAQRLSHQEALAAATPARGHQIRQVTVRSDPCREPIRASRHIDRCSSSTRRRCRSGGPPSHCHRHAHVIWRARDVHRRGAIHKLSERMDEHASIQCA